jgi:hypothetical protein
MVRAPAHSVNYVVPNFARAYIEPQYPHGRWSMQHLIVVFVIAWACARLLQILGAVLWIGSAPFRGRPQNQDLPASKIPAQTRARLRRWYKGRPLPLFDGKP